MIMPLTVDSEEKRKILEPYLPEGFSKVFLDDNNTNHCASRQVDTTGGRNIYKVRSSEKANIIIFSNFDTKKDEIVLKKLPTL